MNKLLILLGCLCSLTAAARIPLQRERLNIPAVARRVGVESILRLSSEQLLRQKQILDLLMDMDKPLQNQELLNLADSIVLDPSKYIGEIDQEMQHVMQLYRNQQLLRPSETYNMLQDEHVLQLIGCYRILLRSLDWDTLLRNACALRQQINGVLFVNSLVLAIRDRSDTQYIIIPALNEILPRLFYDDEIIRRVESIGLMELSKPSETMRPNLLDLVGLRRRPGMISTLDREQLWKPWQTLRLGMVRQRMEIIRPETRQVLQNKILIPLSEEQQNQGLDLLMQDSGMQSFCEQLAARIQLGSIEYIRQEDGDINRRIQQDSQELEDDRLLRTGRRRIIDIAEGRRVLTDEDMPQNMRSSRSDSERLLHLGRRRQSQVPIRNQRRDGRLILDDSEEEGENEIRRGLPIDMRRLRDQRESQNRRIDQNKLMRGESVLRSFSEWDVRGLPQSRLDDERLLRVGRRRQGETAIPSKRERLLNIMLQTEGVRDGRLIMDDSEEEQGNIRGGLSMDMGRLRGQNRGISERQIMSGEPRLRSFSEWDIRGLPQSRVEDERLLRVGRRRQTPILNQRERLLNTIMHASGVRDGRLIMDDSDEDQMEEDDIIRRDLSIDIRRLRAQRERQNRPLTERQPVIRNFSEWDIRSLPQGQDISERLLSTGRRRRVEKIPERREGRILDEQDEDDEAVRQRMGVRIQQRPIMDRDRSRMQLKRPNGVQREWLPENLPQVDVNDERLLHIGRRNLLQSMQDTEEKRLMNSRMYAGIRDGRLVEDDGSDEIDRRLEEIKRRLGGLESDLNIVNLRSTNMQNERLLRLSRRRNPLMSNNIRDGRLIETEDDLPLITDLDQQDIQNRLQRMIGMLQKRLNMLEMRIRQLEGLGNMPNVLVQLEKIRIAQTNIREMLDIATQIQQRLKLGLNIKDAAEIQDLARDIQNLSLTDVNIERLLNNSPRRMDRDRYDVLSEEELSRRPRSVGRQQISKQQQVNLQVMIHVLQQIIARINMERISLRMPSLSDNPIEQTLMQARRNNPRLLEEQDELYGMRMNERRLGEQRQRIVLQKLNELSDMLQKITADRLREIQSTRDIDVLVGLALKDKILDIKRAVLVQIHQIKDISEISRLGNMGYFMSEPIAQATLECVIKMINMKRQELKAYTRQELEMPGVQINNIIVDRLRTYEELVDVDMSSIVPPQEKQQQTQIIMRERRLNHKEFNIRVEIDSDKAERVILRLLMTPTVDSLGKQLRIEDIQLNTLVLDAMVADLTAGRNVLQIRSKDIAWSMRDTTPITEIYRRVMLAIKGQLPAGQDDIIQQRCALPHRLLLPRGRPDGLPMQIIAVISPVTEQDLILQQQGMNRIICSMGTATLNLDNLPLLYPMDRKLQSLDDLRVSNIMMKDILIYHEQ